MAEASIDLQQVRREIEADVRARRASGEYPPGFERELDELFDRFAPADATTDLDAALDRVEESIAIEPIIPTTSTKPGVGALKRAIAKLIGWYHAFVAQQMTELGVAVSHALRLLWGRVDALERGSGTAARVHAEQARVAPDRDDGIWADGVAEELRGREGRIAICEAGAGDLVAALVAAGFDAYGIEPRFRLAEAAVARGLEVRIDEGLGHLRTVSPGDLDAVVLRGCVEHLRIDELLELVDLVAAQLSPGGRIVVCSVAPAAWGRERTELEADLAPGRPLHPSTWESLLASRCFADMHVRMYGSDEPLEPLPGAHPDAALLNNHLARISRTLFGPDSFIVAATRAANP